MDFINFESVKDKEVVREELRAARSELLRRAEIDAKKRAEKNADKELRGDNKWMLPSISKKLKKSSKSSKKKKKKDSKSSKKSKKRSKNYSSTDSSSDTDSSEEEKKILKKSKKKKSKKSKKRSSSSNDSSSNESDEWVENVKSNIQKSETISKPGTNAPLVRDDWMTSGDLFMKTYAKEKKDIKKNSFVEYDPATSTRELNPHWKNSGDGLPSFKKPTEDESSSESNRFNKTSSNDFRTGGWRKQSNPATDKNDIKDKRQQSYREREQSYREHNEDQYESRHTRREESDRQHFDSRKIRRDDIDRKHFDSKQNRQDEIYETPKSESSSNSDVSDKEENDVNFLTDQQMNELAAKIIKAEIMGNEDQVKAMKEQLENARNVRSKIKETCKKDALKVNKKGKEDEHILLTVTDKDGNVRPYQGPAQTNENYTGKHKKRVETHVAGKRVRYFPDDERYDINNMFTRERNIRAEDNDLQFAEIAGKNKNPNDDLEDIFADSIRRNPKDEAKRQEEQAIQQQERLQKILDDCDKCFNTQNFKQNLMVSMGSTVYLTLPEHEGLQPGHCLIVPMQHTTCSTRLDEDVWTEITEYRKCLTRMFEARKLDVIFFEIARYLNRSPHMVIHCIPCKAEMAPFYFKKAIQESEQEWSTNKQLISLKDKDLKRSIPKGLPYFWVHFGMDSGFAHVIEDQSRFPENYAQEIIGNMLNLNPRMWRKPRPENNVIQKVKQFADWFKLYDFTNKR